ncbi:MAG: formate--tetrahydrofolate ligase [Candidatus Omnitrophota bacterium]
MLSDLAIAGKTKLARIDKIARSAGIPAKYVEILGTYKAKISLDFLKDNAGRRRKGRATKYIIVSAITPGPLGEGKTVTTIGLSMALNRIGRRSIVSLRQPSMGPTFGRKGGGTGGGYSQVMPRGDINLHFTGDTHAVGIAHNLLAAFMDNSLFRDNPLGIDPATISWPRAIDINDRSLRDIRIGLDEKKKGYSRETGFEIIAASELMAILALSEDILDMRRRLDKIVVAFARSGRPVTAGDLKVSGAMAALLKEALKPNLVQTIERTPCFIHTGPFANIAHGNSSIIADKMAFGLSDYVVTESGFGADLGGEKFFDIKCRASGLKPNAAVLVCTVRSLKMHSGRFAAGSEAHKRLFTEDLDALGEGLANLEKQIGNIRRFDVPLVVAINRFNTDTEREIALVKKKALFAGANDAITSDLWQKGSQGGLKLAEAVIRASESRAKFNFLYPLNISIKEKIAKVGHVMYGADKISYSSIAERKILRYEKLGYSKLPVCIAKTHLSLSADPFVKGAPRGFTLPVKDVYLAAGAGFVTVMCGAINTMPGLPAKPIGERIDIDKRGNIVGLA